MSIQNLNGFTSIEQIRNQYLNNTKEQTKKVVSENSFESILKDKQNFRIENNERFKFSKHASIRLSERNIDLTNEQIDRLQEGTKLAQEKGINESLMLLDDLAFIVNVKNNTVITAMDSKNTNERVFTNIDGAVIV